MNVRTQIGGLRFIRLKIDPGKYKTAAEQMLPAAVFVFSGMIVQIFLAMLIGNQ